MKSHVAECYNGRSGPLCATKGVECHGRPSSAVVGGIMNALALHHNVVGAMATYSLPPWDAESRGSLPHVVMG